MARYRKIDTRIWGDSKFRKLSPLQPSGQALWLYLLTNPETTNVPGLYRAGEAGLAEALGWGLETFREAFREAFREGLAIADWDHRVVWIPNVIRYDPPASPNVVRGWRAQWDEIPECSLKLKAWRHILSYFETRAAERKGAKKGGKSNPKAFTEAFREACPEPLPKAFGDPSPKPLRKDLGLVPAQEQEQEQEQEQNKRERPQTDKLENLGDLEALGYPKFGQLAGVAAATAQSFLPIYRHEFEHCSANNGRSWAYFFRVLETYRQAADETRPAGSPHRKLSKRERGDMIGRKMDEIRDTMTDDEVDELGMEEIERRAAVALGLA